jgi:hypothetical protein
MRKHRRKNDDRWGNMPNKNTFVNANNRLVKDAADGGKRRQDSIVGWHLVER